MIVNSFVHSMRESGYVCRTHSATYTLQDIQNQDSARALQLFMNEKPEPVDNWKDLFEDFD